MKKIQYIISFLILFTIFIFVASPALAQYGLQETGKAAGITQTTTLPKIIGLIINVLLSLVGVGFLGLMIYAGILYLTSQGEPKPVEQAKSLIKSAIIGLIIVFAAYAITDFVMSQIITPFSSSSVPSSDSSVPEKLAS